VRQDGKDVTIRSDRQGNSVVQDSKTGRATHVIVDGKSYNVHRTAKADKL
jgi:hypothetical protein